jgi:hypothetical protein
MFESRQQRDCARHFNHAGDDRLLDVDSSSDRGRRNANDNFVCLKSRLTCDNPKHSEKHRYGFHLHAITFRSSQLYI